MISSKFLVKGDKKIVNGIPKYIKSDYSFDFDPVQSSSYSILIGDLTISFDWKFTARQAWGYCPDTRWNEKTLDPPNSIKGSLILTDDIENDQRVTGSENWKTYHDSTSGWVCIGDFSVSKEDISVEFATNIVAVLTNSEIKAIWINPIFEG